MNEAGIDKDVEISYIYGHNYKKEEMVARLKHADIIFFTTSVIPDDKRLNNFIQTLHENSLCAEKLRVIGSKKYGVCNGQIYAHHNKPDYWDATVEIDNEYFSKNKEFKSKWGEQYIDMVTPVWVENNRVRVFSDDHKYICQDCEHLTAGGAKYYAKLLKPILLKQIEWSTNKKQLVETTYSIF